MTGYRNDIASKRAYNRFKQLFRSRLYEGKVGLFELFRHWWTVRKIVRSR